MHAHRTQATLGWSPQRTPVHAKPSAPQQRIVVVIPAHNERERLPGCLQSLTVAAGRVAIPVHVVVVLDACTDGTGEVVPASVHTVTISARNVGAARAAGFAALASGAGAETWLASTDADTHVPPGWLINHDDHHRTGAEAVVGTVAVHWHEHSGATRRRYERRYRLPGTCDSTATATVPNATKRRWAASRHGPRPDAYCCRSTATMVVVGGGRGPRTPIPGEHRDRHRIGVQRGVGHPRQHLVEGLLGILNHTQGFHRLRRRPQPHQRIHGLISHRHAPSIREQK
jgi:hypothetical protein